VLAVAFVGLYLYDRAVIHKVTEPPSGQSETPSLSQLDWYLPLRLRLTAVVVICLVLCVVLL